MSLADYEPERLAVVSKGRELFKVRGLSLDDLTVLMRSHGADIESMIAIYDKGVRDDAAVAAMTQYAIALVKEAPGLVANAIALASDEPDEVDRARTLGIAQQIDAVKAIGKLTFEEAGGPKKLFESLIGLFRNVAPTVLS